MTAKCYLSTEINNQPKEESQATGTQTSVTSLSSIPLADILQYYPVMQKFTTSIILFTMLAGGVHLLYRSFLNSNDLMVIDGKVLNKQFEQISTRKGSSRYGLTFSIDSYSSKLGIYAGTAEQLSKNEKIELIDSGKVYTFLIDPTAIEDDGINLGVREIKLLNKTIYKESQNFNLFAGSFFIMLSGIGLYVINKYKRK